MQDKMSDCSPEHWKEVLQYMSTPNDNEMPSHLLLCFLLLTQEATTEYRSICSQVVSFLASHYHRSSIRLAAAWYEVHIKWAEFFDGKSGIHCKTTQTYSTRLLELPTFGR